MPIHQNRKKPNEYFNHGNEYQRQLCTRVLVLVKNDCNIMQRIEDAQNVTGLSRSALFIKAIEEYLDKYGF